MKKIFFLCFVVLLFMAPVCNNNKSEGVSMIIKAKTFKDGDMIPIEYSCEGNNESPELLFENVPKNAKSLALIMDDPDAPGQTFVHWVVWNIDPKTEILAKNIKENALSINQGMNSYSKTGYKGPCPPKGETHRYYFKLYALDIKPELSGTSNKSDLLESMKGHIIAESQLIAKYKKVN